MGCFAGLGELACGWGCEVSVRGALSACDGALGVRRFSSALGRLLFSGRVLVALLFLFGGTNGWFAAFVPPGVLLERFASEAGARASLGEVGA